MLRLVIAAVQEMLNRKHKRIDLIQYYADEQELAPLTYS